MNGIKRWIGAVVVVLLRIVSVLAIVFAFAAALRLLLFVMGFNGVPAPVGFAFAGFVLLAQILVAWICAIAIIRVAGHSFMDAFDYSWFGTLYALLDAPWRKLGLLKVTEDAC